MLAKKTNLVQQTENKKLRLSVERGGKRISEIDKLIEKVFEQNVAGILSDERFPNCFKIMSVSKNGYRQK